MTQLIADKLTQDPRLKEGKRLILEAVNAYKKQLTKVRAADPEKTLSYQALLNAFTACRGLPLFYPYIGSGLGHGALVELADGSVKYDFITGIGVHYMGHSDDALISAALDAAVQDTVMQGNLQQNREGLELCETLLKASGMDHCFLTTSGAMANENALKLVLQKRSPASRLLAFDHCFSGRTWALSQITDKPSFREGLPLSLAVDYLPFYDADHPEESLSKTLQYLETYTSRYPKQHAALICELIQGEGGFYSGSSAFFRKLFERCRALGIAVIADEVQSFGRTSALFAYQHFGVADLIDVATVGKLLQVCATLFRKEYCPKAGLLSQTFTGSTSSLRAGQTILKQLLEGNFLGQEGQNNALGDYFRQKLEQLKKREPGLIEGPFGIGSMVAFTPFKGDSTRVADYLQRLFNAGVMAFTAGSQPTRVRFLLPVGSLSFRDLDEAFPLIESTLRSSP